MTRRAPLGARVALAGWLVGAAVISPWFADGFTATRVAGRAVLAVSAAGVPVAPGLYPSVSPPDPVAAAMVLSLYGAGIGGALCISYYSVIAWRRLMSTMSPGLSRRARVRALAQVPVHLYHHPELQWPAAVLPAPTGGGPVTLRLPMLVSGSPRLLLAWHDSLRGVEAITARPLPGGELVEVTVTGRLGARSLVAVCCPVRMVLPSLAVGVVSMPLEVDLLRRWQPTGAAAAVRLLAAAAHIRLSPVLPAADADVEHTPPGAPS